MPLCVSQNALFQVFSFMFMICRPINLAPQGASLKCSNKFKTMIWTYFIPKLSKVLNPYHRSQSCRVGVTTPRFWDGVVGFPCNIIISYWPNAQEYETRTFPKVATFFINIKDLHRPIIKIPRSVLSYAPPYVEFLGRTTPTSFKTRTSDTPSFQIRLA